MQAELPVEGRIVARSAVDDKGEGRGAVIVSRRDIEDSATGRLIARVTESAFARGDGGIGSTGDTVPRPAPVPEGPPDRRIHVPTSPRAAAIYRLMGDDNPLYIDPDFARAAGFPGPILHGLATYGHIARAVMRDSPTRAIRMMDCRFTAPVFPGDELDLFIWDGPDGIALRAEVGGRPVVNNGEIAFAWPQGKHITQMMRAVLSVETGGPEALRIRDIPVPDPGPGEVRIRVAAVGSAIPTCGSFPTAIGIAPSGLFHPVSKLRASSTPGMKVCRVMPLTHASPPCWDGATWPRR